MRPSSLWQDKHVEVLDVNEVDYDVLRHLEDRNLKELVFLLGACSKVLAATRP